MTLANLDRDATVAKRVDFAENVAFFEGNATYVEAVNDGESATTMTFTVADMNARVTKRITVFRERAGFTQEQLGASLDPPVRRNEVNRWEAGDHMPRPATLFQIADVLGIDPGLFFSPNGDGPS